MVAGETSATHIPSARIRDYLIQRQGLDQRSDEPAAAMVRRLEAVQIDPVNLLARNHELALHCRLRGRHAGQIDYYPDLFEYIAGNRALLPLTDWPIFVPFMRWRGQQHRETLGRLADPIRQVLQEMERSGPLTSRQFASTEKVSGYWDPAEVRRTKATTLALQLLWEIGVVTVVGRRGAECVYDLAERAVPTNLWRLGREMPLEEARRQLREKYYRAMGVFDPGHPFFGWQQMTARERAAVLTEDEQRGVVEPLPLQGVRRRYWTLAGTVDRLVSTPVPDVAAGAEARFLPPLDNLLWRRERLIDLFGFEYRWEIYTSARRRKGGPYTMPILYGSELVGRLDAHLDRESSRLVVDGLRYEPGISVSPSLQDAVDAEIEQLRSFCEAQSTEKTS